MPVPCPTTVASEGATPAWGFEPRELHDHFWALHGMRVVRRGAGRFEPARADTYLLLDEDELVLFDPRQAIALASGRRGGMVTLGVTESDGRDYSERVIADESGRLVSVRRSYAPAVLRETEVLITGNPLFASLWRRSPETSAGRRDVRLAAGLHGHRDASCTGRIFDAENASEADRCIHHVVRHWHDGAPVWACGRAPATAPRRVGRRVFDIVFSLAALALTAPLYPLIMLAIWLEDGRPFFFAHTRQTVGGRNFACYKIRTMAKNADASKKTLAARNVCDGPQFHIEDDPRLLRVGRLLRRLHLDELPQFINVLLGQMSVIGPRPSPDDENQFCPAWREARLSVKPGITGLWQVDRTRAPHADFQEWIRHDLEYVERRSFTLDAVILYKTIEDVCRRLAGHLPGGTRRRRAA
ncbi:MAG: sugar transferase [Planctomycetota bacterium]|jgi:lipopolysaccharide/colanic/teichoic acid biosynthesis glycosyltransferase